MRVFIACALLVVCTACEDRPQPVIVGAPPTAGPSGDGEPTGTGACAFDKVRSLSESCCESYGVDACGAGLFCAAFDGRSVATCYPDNVRVAGETCGADRHCLSDTCGTKGLCAALATEPCEADWGCAPVKGERWVCVQKECRAVADGYCETEADCTGGLVCRGGLCRDPAFAKYAGEACTESAPLPECLSGRCFKGTCQCDKESGAGCPDGNHCTGGTHVRWGTRCE